jgi:hypothetical protein
MTPMDADSRRVTPKVIRSFDLRIVAQSSFELAARRRVHRRLSAFIGVRFLNNPA